MKKLSCILVLIGSLIHGVLAQKSLLFSHPYQPLAEKGSVKQFLDHITHSTGIIIEYASGSIDTGKVIQLSGSPSTVGQVLNQLLKEEHISVEEKNNKIILIPSDNPLPADFFLSHYNVYGTIREAVSGEPLSYASIWEPTRQWGTISNANGQFTLALPEGSQTLWISYAGYESRKVEIDLKKNTRIDFELVPRSEIQEVTIRSPDYSVRKGDEKVNLEAEGYNLLLGESDALRSLFLIPGVKNMPEIMNGLLIRGGSPDQNIFLLDGNTIFNPSHLLGMISILNRASVKSLNLYKSNFPCRYGGGLSSIIDVQSKDGNLKKWEGEANAALLAGSFTIDGPIKKDHSALMLSFRQSWVNPLLKLYHSGIGINFYDLQFKYTQLIGRKDKLMVSGYVGHDQLELHKDYTNNRQQWGNKAMSLTWSRIMSPRSFLTTALSLSSYNNLAGFRYSLYDSTGNNVQDRVYNTFSSIQRYSARTQLEWSPGNILKMNIGAEFAKTKIHPFDANISEDFVDKPDYFTTFPPLSFREAVLFYENEIRASTKLFIKPGLHVSNFRYRDFHYTSWQPRFYTVYSINKHHFLEASYNHMTQYLHLVTNPYLGINSDVSLPSTAVLRPEESDMVNFGYTYRQSKKFLIGAEIYYKQLNNVTNYAEGKNLFLNTAGWEDILQSGKGWCYGLEVRADKNMEKFQAHLSYTLSWNWRKFSDVNNGQKFPFKYDRRHDLNVAATYLYNQYWNFSAIWTFATGSVFTLPDKVYPDFDDAQQISDPQAPREYRLIYHSSTTNQFRTLPYHRLDLSASYRHIIRKKFISRFGMGIYNIYGSPSQYLYDLEGTLGKRSLIVNANYQVFRITPYVSYSIAF